jgi:hypothetical protein
MNAEETRTTADVMITTVQEPDGRWLAYCEQYRVASYGTSRGDALELTRNMLAEVSPDPEWLAANSFAMPDLGDDDLVGPELMKVLVRWTGLSEDSFDEHDEDE